VSISLRRGAARPARTAGGLIVAAALGSASVLTFARQADDPSQTFRTAVDVIRIDATVLDKDRRPIRGLTAADFTVLENGKPQRIVAVQEIDTVANDPEPSAWMRYAPRDVIGNDLSDQLSDGQALAIVMDDDHIVGRQVHVELETVRAGGHADVKCRDGVLRPEIASATVREHLWTARKELAQGLGLKAEH